MSRVLIDSGIGYLGNIPNDWNVHRIKNAFNYKKEIVKDEWENYQLLSLTTVGVKKKDIDNPNGKLPESFEGYQVVNKNDLIMCLFDLDCSAVFSGLSKYDGMISPAYKVIECKNSMNPNYAGYYFKYIGFDRTYMHYSKNIRYTLNYEEFSSLPMIFPSIEEQKKIADYLDKKNSKIDEIIKDNSKEIELLNEYKHSIILDYVTKGIKKEKFIDSNVDWIGKIPYNWQIKKGKYIFDLPLSSYNNHIYEKEVNLVRVEHLNSTIGEFRIKEEFDRIKVNKETEMIKPPMILTPKRGGAIYTNKVKIINSPCVLDPNVMALKTNENLKFYAYVLSGKKLSNLADISTIPQLNNKHIYNVYFPVPPRIEEEQIVSLLDKKVNIINKVIDYRKQIIEKLEEYKKSLIYECVTGKREV